MIDDLGGERSTEYVMKQMFFVTDSRYRSRGPMIITTNLKLAELKSPSWPIPVFMPVSWKDASRSSLQGRTSERKTLGLPDRRQKVSANNFLLGGAAPSEERSAMSEETRIM